MEGEPTFERPWQRSYSPSSLEVTAEKQHAQYDVSLHVYWRKCHMGGWMDDMMIDRQVEIIRLWEIKPLLKVK